VYSDGISPTVASLGRPYHAASFSFKSSAGMCGSTSFLSASWRAWAGVNPSKNRRAPLPLRASEDVMGEQVHASEPGTGSTPVPRATMPRRSPISSLARKTRHL